MVEIKKQADIYKKTVGIMHAIMWLSAIEHQW
jgi:hypothetical protein